MTDKQCDRCGEVNPAEIHTCTPKQAYPENFIDALRYHTAINEQPEQEPVAWMYEYGTDHGDAVNQIFWHKNLRLEKPTGLVRNVVPLYTAPPQREEGCAECGKKQSDGWALYCVKCSEPVREWQGLTDEEMEEAMKYWSDPCRSAYGGAEAADDEYVDMIGTWRYIEAKLKEKNGG